MVAVGVATINGVLLSGLLLAVGGLLWLVRGLRRRDGQLATLRDTLVEQDRLALLGRLLAGVAHDLNTPLGAVRCSLGTRQKAISIMASAVAELAPESQPSAESLSRMERALKALADTEPILAEALARADHLVGEVRLAGRGQPPTTEPVDINELIRGTLLLARHELHGAVVVELELGDIAPVNGRRGALGRVIMNLLLNARQAAGDGGKIAVSTSMSDGYVVITVADSGPGLPPGAAAEIFEPGFTTRGESGGSGLGLYVSHRVVSQHNGRLTATNGAGGGAEFKVELPTSATGSGGPGA